MAVVEGSNGNPGLLRRLWWIIAVLWVVAGIRLMMDFQQVEDPIAMHTGGLAWQKSIGVYYVVLPLLLIGAFSGVFRGLSYGRLVKAMLVLAVMCWFIPNAISYTTAQLRGWTHGRFRPPAEQTTDAATGGAPMAATAEPDAEARSAPLGKTTAEKVRIGLTVATFTTGAGFVWLFAMMNLLVYLPRRLFGVGA